VNSIRPAAFVTSVIGGIASAGMLLMSGRNNANIVALVVMFIIWVTFPFVLLAWANYLSPRWSALTRTTLQAVTFVTTAATLAIFAYRLMRPPAKTGAFVFVIVPPVGVVLCTLAVWGAATVSRRRGT
jgi:hypothetical protein